MDMGYGSDNGSGHGHGTAVSQAGFGASSGGLALPPPQISGFGGASSAGGFHFGSGAPKTNAMPSASGFGVPSFGTAPGIAGSAGGAGFGAAPGIAGGFGSAPSSGSFSAFGGGGFGSSSSLTNLAGAGQPPAGDAGFSMGSSSAANKPRRKVRAKGIGGA